MYIFKLLGKHQVRDMDVYLEPLIDEILRLWVDISMYDIFQPIGQKQFQFHGILTWTIHDVLGLTHFFGVRKFVM